MRSGMGRTAAILGASLCAGCISLLPEQGEPIALYTLDGSHAPAPSEAAELATGPVISVDSPSGPLSILGDDLVWREDNAISFVAEAGWAGAARIQLQRLLIELLGQSSSVRAVSASGEGARPDLIVRWDIAHFEVAQGPQRPTAQFSATAQLIDARTRQLLGVRRLYAEKPLERRSTQEAATALRSVARQGVEDLASWVAAQSAAYPPRPAQP